MHISHKALGHGWSACMWDCMLIICDRGINWLFIMFPHIMRNDWLVLFIGRVTNLMLVWSWLACHGLKINGLGQRVPSSHHHFLIINCKRNLIMPTISTFTPSTSTINTTSPIVVMTIYTWSITLVEKLTRGSQMRFPATRVESRRRIRCPCIVLSLVLQLSQGSVLPLWRRTTMMPRVGRLSSFRIRRNTSHREQSISPMVNELLQMIEFHHYFAKLIFDLKPNIMVNFSTKEKST